MAAPRVSIVTPSFNQAAYLREAIESVRAQTHPEVEHVVVDGGSTDGTQEILAEYEGLTWVSEPDRGQSHALNKGFAMARGTVLGWLNADDLYEPHAVSEGLRALDETGAGLVYADVTRVDDDHVNPRRIRSRPAFDLWTELNLGCGIYSPAVFFTREAFEAVGGVDESLHLTMDYDLWLRIGKRAATSRSIAIAASPNASMNEPIICERRSRPSPASADRRCQTTFAPWLRATQAAARSGESLRCTSGKRCSRISRSSCLTCGCSDEISRLSTSQRSPS
jgi:hypothetical protein